MMMSPGGSQGFVRRISSKMRWLALKGAIDACGRAGDGEGTEACCCGAGMTLSAERYLKKLRPVPGIVKEIQIDPVGERPIRKPAKPQLTPTPREVNVVLAPRPRFIKSRQRHAIGMPGPQRVEYQSSCAETTPFLRCRASANLPLVR